MTYSEFTVTFVDDLIIDDLVSLQIGDLNDVISGPIKEKWVNFRSQSYQVTVGTPTTTPGERSAINFALSFGLDYNGLQVYEISRVLNVVTIKCKVPTIKFFQPVVANPANVVLVINNTDGSGLLTIDSVVFSVATTNPVCTHYKVTVTTSVLATNILTPIVNNSNTDNPFSFELLRNHGFFLSCTSSSGQLVGTSYASDQVPGTFVISEINIVNSPNGATVTAFVDTIGINTFQYSLDNATWQDSNVFSGQPEGSYTLYVKDNYGCTITKDFVIADNGINTPFSYISKSNTIPFVERVTYGYCGPYKTDENTLSNEAFAFDSKLAYPEYVPFQTCDTPENQILSNYSNIVVKVLKSDGAFDNISINKLTNNIGRKDARDAIKYDLGDGKTGIYFVTGNIYDYDTDADTGNDYSLNGFLPEWAKIGTYFSIDGTFYEIKNIYHDSDLNYEVIVIDSVYTGTSPDDIIVKCIYNRQTFEVHEFVIPMSSYNDSIIQVSIDETDDNFDDKSWLSEKICVKTRHENTVEIEAYSPDNDDVVYAFGLKHKIRVILNNWFGDHEDESELNKGDDESSLINSDVYELEVFEFGPVTKNRYRQLTRLLSKKIVKIDGVAVAKNGKIEKEGPLEESNLHLVKATMIRTNADVNNSGVVTDEITTASEELEVPNLLITNEGDFISQ